MKKSSIIGKIVITGKLILKSPLLIGSGADDSNDTNDKDIHVLKNQEGEPFIPGTSLCGVLREYMMSSNPQMVKYIFGDPDTKPTNNQELLQSSIQLEDIPLVDHKIVFRDGVKIDGFTGTGIKGGKYNYEAIDRGAFGTLQLLVTLRGCHTDSQILDSKEYTIENVTEAIADLMRKLKDGIRLGALTTKGFGQVQVENISAGLYDFRKRVDVISWLSQKKPSPDKASTKILPSDKKKSNSPEDIIVDAHFAFNSSFIIKDYDTNEREDGIRIAAVSLYSEKNKEYIIPGTSLKGILRHRAEYILRKFGCSEDLLENLMGSSDSEKKLKSRFIVSESYVSTENVKPLSHAHNRIDRLTGGTLQSMLFKTKPVWQKNFEAPTLNIHFEIHKASEAEAGLAIFLLRDLCLGHVAIGGEKSIGRGTLRGISARISYADKDYELDKSGKVTSGEAKELSRLAGLVKTYASEAGGVK